MQSPYALGNDDLDQPEIIYQPIEEEIEEIVEINEEIEEEICNELIIQEEISDSKTEDNIIEIIQDSEIIDETDLEVSVIHCDEESPKLIRKKKKHKEVKIPINCHIHCLEKPELDLINKGYDTKNMKTFEELNLKLMKKKCCKRQEQPKLPSYNGVVSEYGLTEEQIERKRIKRERKEKRRREKLIRNEEDKIQRDMYNEEIFCAWLKSLEIRNKNKITKNCYQSYDERKRPQSHQAVRNKYRDVRPRTATGQNQYNTIILYPGVVMKTLI